jgi:peroxiredoxin Q/BCP
VRIVGASFDPPEENLAWAEQEGFQYELWSDLERDLALYYGAAATDTQPSASRLTFLLDADGTLILEYSSISTQTHPSEVLEDCQAIFGAR